MLCQAFHTQVDEHEHEQVGDKSGIDKNSASQQNENYPMSWIIKVCSDLIIAKEDIDCNHSNAQEHWDDFHRQAIGKVSHDESEIDCLWILPIFFLCIIYLEDVKVTAGMTAKGSTKNITTFI